jgi:hypothetical protein
MVKRCPISAETPKVILQQGTAGTSTIYTNNTSAKVSVSPPTGFEHNRAFKSSDVSVSTTSGTPVDDSEANLTVTLQRDSYTFVIYSAENKRGSTEDYDGKGCAINVDGADVAFSWQSPYDNDKANSVTVWGGFLAAGSHTIKGRFFANYPRYTVTVSYRQLLVLAFPRPATYDHVLEVVNQVTDLWRIRLRSYDQSNIGRLSYCTIYFHNGAGISRQIYIYDGTYSQQFGNWYDLTGLSTVYIAMATSVTSTGTSYVYAYLEVLVPGISAYNLMVIAFKIT